MKKRVIMTSVMVMLSVLVTACGSSKQSDDSEDVTHEVSVGTEVDDKKTSKESFSDGDEKTVENSDSIREAQSGTLVDDGGSGSGIDVDVSEMSREDSTSDVKENSITNVNVETEKSSDLIDESEKSNDSTNESKNPSDLAGESEKSNDIVNETEKTEDTTPKIEDAEESDEAWSAIMDIG